MTKYLIELTSEDDFKVFQVDADSQDEAREKAAMEYPSHQITRIKHSHGGKRDGAGRTGKWGVKTQVYRLPPSIGDKAEEIVGELEIVNHILDSWQSKVNESKSKSANGQPSERYKYVAQLVGDLRQAMKVTGEKF